MPKFSSQSAVLIFLAVSIEPASARMCCGASFRPFSMQQRSFQPITVSPYRSGGYLPGGQLTSSQKPVNPRGRLTTYRGIFPQTQANPYGPGGYAPQAASYSSLAAGYCTLSSGEGCQTLNPPGSDCECRDNYGRHFRGVAR
jgi:hypothetical protein